MNGYVNFRQDYLDLIVSAITTGDPNPVYVRTGSFKYIKELYELNKPVYASSSYGRAVPSLYLHPLGEAYILCFDIGFQRFYALFTEDDTITIQLGG